jgi:hypothetical protein
LMSSTVRWNTWARTACSMNLESSPLFMRREPRYVRSVESVSFETRIFQRTACCATRHIMSAEADRFKHLLREDRSHSHSTMHARYSLSTICTITRLG